MAQNANVFKIDQSKGKTHVKIHNSEGRIIDNLPKYTSLLQFGHFGIFDWNKNGRFGMASEAFWTAMKKTLIIKCEGDISILI